MSNHTRFKIRSLDQLLETARVLGVNLPVSADLGILGTPLEIAGRTVPNRFAVHPMEGFDSDGPGAPGELSFRRYRRYAAGGAGLIWFEATAVLNEGRSNPGQLCLRPETADTFAKLVEAPRQAAAEAGRPAPVLVLQMTHSGRYSKPTGIPTPIIAHRSPILDPKHKLPADYPVVTDDYLDRLQDAFVAAAKLAAAAGFDGLDVKACHRYLVSELLASHTREGKYGGSLENRSRFLRETLARIRAAVPGVFVTTRMSVYDAISHPYGFGVSTDDYKKPDLREPLEVIRQLRDIGIPLLNISIGNPYYNPHFGRPYDFPIAGMSVPDEHPLAGAARILDIDRQVQQANPGLPVISTGFAWLRQFMPQVAAGVLRQGWASLIGQGRGSFAYPDAVKDILETGAMRPEKCCVTCSACTQIMRDGGRTGCVVRDSEIYGPQYRLARRFAYDRLLAEARRCRDCEQATCSRGCPAGIDIPAFIKAFADENIAKAYDILRANNVLPEMCGFICPAAEQCQGGCVEEIFCEQPVPIQDIQLFTARTARLQGLTGVRLPAKASGKTVAVVGAGPAGLACAIRLLEAGHQVEIFERDSRLGGTPDQSIPGARFGDAQAEVEAILAPAKAAGRVRVHSGRELGVNLSLADLRAGYAAVFLAVGLGRGVSIGNAPGVMDAIDFLKAVKAGSLKIVPDKVAVLGAGNTAMDAAMSALRLGCRDVYIVYRRSFAEMPAWKEERDAFLDAGGHLLTLTQPLAYETAGGKLTGLRVARTELGEPDASGRRRPVPLPDSESVLPVGMVVEALGQQLSDALRQALPGLKFSRAGLIAADPATGATSVPGVYAAGDAVNGGTTAVQAIAEGMRAAAAIAAQLR